MNINRLIRDNIKALKPYSSARDEFKEFSSDIVFLDANENPFNNGVNRYPDPQQLAVKTKLSEIKNVPIENILLGNGSDEVLDLIFRVFCEPNKDTIIVLPPTYGMYSVLANTNAVGITNVPLDKDFQPEVNKILETADSSSKLLFLCSPNNPTANSFNAKKVEDLIKGFKGIVVIDEAYVDFSNQESWASQLNKFPNLIITQTLSKAYGMAGIRLGICFASKEIISALNKIKPPYNVNELTQTRAFERLIKIEDVNQEIAFILKERKRLINDLKEIAFVEKIYPSDSNFLLLKVDDATKRYDELIKRGIVVRNRTNQHGCENCLRFTIGIEKENTRLLNTLKDIQEWEGKYSL